MIAHLCNALTGLKIFFNSFPGRCPGLVCAALSGEEMGTSMILCLSIPFTSINISMDVPMDLSNYLTIHNRFK
jgi:hypothetical protein